MLEWETPELDRTDLGPQIEHEKIQQLLQCWWKILVLIHQLALQVSHIVSQSLTNRNVGMGDPWAGQDRLRLSDCAWEDPIIVSVLIENLGFDPPMGSIK